MLAAFDEEMTMGFPLSPLSEISSSIGIDAKRGVLKSASNLSSDLFGPDR